MPEKTPDKSLTALNWLNFFAADVSDGVGPFLAVYLTTNLKWNPSNIGIAIAATQISMVLAQSPAGFVVDNTRNKRRIIIIATLITGVTALVFSYLQTFAFIVVCQVIIGLATSFYTPTLVSLASAIGKKENFDRTISKNQSFNHAGNVAAAVFTGVVARFTNNKGIFYCVSVLAVFCTGSALFISKKEAESQPTSEHQDKEEKKGFFRDVIHNKVFLLFLLLTLIFYFSNGALLPLVAQEIARHESKNSTLYLSACIIIAQLVMVPTVYVCGKKAGAGRKKLLMFAFILLGARALLYTFTDKTGFLLPLQILDGMAAGTFSVTAMMVVDDLMGASGKASFAQGILATALSLGSTLSNTITGFIVNYAGFTMGFTFLSALAFGALILLWKAMPETLQKK